MTPYGVTGDTIFENGVTCFCYSNQMFREIGDAMTSFFSQTFSGRKEKVEETEVGLRASRQNRESPWANREPGRAGGVYWENMVSSRHQPPFS